MTRRLNYIDWLRVLAVLLLFPFHTSRVFNYGEPFYIKSVYLSQAINIFIAFVDRWHMPLFFLLAGASTYFSLAKRSSGQYAWERVLRLFVPLVFGILVVIPPQTFVGATYNSGYTGTYWQYIASGAFLKWNLQPAGDYYGGLGIGQLWFILFLFLMSLVALPFFAWGRRRGTKSVQAWARALGRPIMWLVPPVFIFFAEAGPSIAGKNFIYYLVFFVFGFIVIADESFAESAERYLWLELAVGTIVCLAWALTAPFRDSLPDPSLPLAAYMYVVMLGEWMMLLGMLGAGRRWLDRPSVALAYLGESSYPVYILHQTVIVVVASFVVYWHVPGVVQWLLVLTFAVAGTFAIYEGVRRVGALRFLFGMRPKVRALPAEQPVAEEPPEGEPA